MILTRGAPGGHDGTRPAADATTSSAREDLPMGQLDVPGPVPTAQAGAATTDPATTATRAEQDAAPTAPSGSYLAATILAAIAVALLVAGIAYLRSRERA